MVRSHKPERPADIILHDLEPHSQDSLLVFTWQRLEWRDRLPVGQIDVPTPAYMLAPHNNVVYENAHNFASLSGLLRISPRLKMPFRWLRR